MKVKSAWKCRNQNCGHEHLVDPGDGLSRCPDCNMGEPTYLGGRYDYSDERRTEAVGVMVGRKKARQ